MRLKTLRIDDFGCFRNARLDDIAEDLVVIGGPQRAGKTTFMRALRQFRGGVGRSGQIPPATDEHRIDAEITHNGSLYRYVLNGHATPSISPIDGGPEIDIDDLFGPVTERQYQQLYTISLDELRRLPPGIDDTEDLAQVLLGGAYGDIAEIPEVQETFRKRAHDIGLKRGDPSAKTTDLNAPYRMIREGMDARREASKQVDEYKDVTDELQSKRSEKQGKEDALKAERRKRDRLSVLSELFEPLQRIDELEVELAEADVSAANEFPVHLTDRLEHFEEQFDEAVEELAEAQRAFEHDTDLSTDGYREWLLDNEDEITALDDERKLWAETIDDLAEQETELEEQRREIESHISDLHSDWGESFSHIEAIETSSVDTARVDDVVSGVSKLREKRDELSDDLSSDRSRREDLKDKLAELEESDETETEVTLPKQKPLIIAAVAVGVGTGASLVTSPIVGGIVGLVTIAVGMYAIDSTVTVEPAVDTEPRRELKATIATLDGDIRASQEQIEGVEERLGEKEDELSELVEELGLPEDLPSKQVSSFYNQVVELNKDIRKYRQERSQWQDERDALASELDAVASLLGDVQEVSWSKESPLENASTLLSTLESAAADLQLAIAVRVASKEREDAIGDIDAVLTSWDEEKSVDESTDDETIYRRIQAFRDHADEASEIVEAAEEREQLESQVASRLGSPSAEKAFAPVREDDEPLTEVAEREAAEFADVEAIQDEIRDAQAEIEDLEGQRDELHDKCLELEKERDELASEEDLQKAQAKIDEGRVEFERVGEAYAVNRIAEKMVSRLHERLMEDVVHSLVDDASEIFSSITQEYDGIELGGELQELEFRALRSTGPDHGVGELSRATAEQLFLAIRLARIRQTDAELPVVLDDAATNFDPDHISRVFEVVGELASTNQVFFLTCHPEFVNLTAAADSPAQYWSLEDGAFTRTDNAKMLERSLIAD